VKISFRAALWGLIVAGVLARLTLAFATFGVAFDINSFGVVGAHLTEPGPLDLYGEVNGGVSGLAAEPVYRWPYPGGFFPWIATSVFIDHRTPLPFHGLIQLPSIAADVALALLVQAFLGWRGAGKRIRLLAAGAVALGPIFAAISGYHGQIDSVAILPAALALVVWVGRGGQLLEAIPLAQVRALAPRMPSAGDPGLSRALIAGALIGAGGAVKVVPLFMVLALLPSAKSLRQGAVLLIAAALIPFVSVLPFLVADPDGVGSILDYRGAPGVGGLGLAVQPDLADLWLLRTGTFDFTGASNFLFDWGARLLIVWLLLLVGFMFRYQPAPVDAAVLVWLTVYSLSPNFFFQYLVWGMPFLLMAGYVRATVALQLVAIGPAVVQFMAPWPNNDIAIPYVAVMLALWLVFVGSLVVMLRETVRSRARHPEGIQPPLVEVERLAAVPAGA
jgi:hypothetical protein